MSHNYELVFRLFMEKLSGNLSPEDEEFVEKQLAEDALFRETWEELEIESKALHTDAFIEKINVQEDLLELKQKLKPQEQPRHRLLFYKRILAAAAVLLLMVSGAYFFFIKKSILVNKDEIAATVNSNKQSINLLLSNGKTLQLSNDSTTKIIQLDNSVLNSGNGSLQYNSDDTTQNTLQVPAGETYKILLSDGTEVWLNSLTSLRFPFRFNGHNREVHIEGEAYFKVKKDATHPFVVHKSLTQVQVLGTSFNVNTYQPQNVKTSLVEGKVVTKSNDGKTMDLMPGYAAEYQTSKGFTADVFEADDVLSWMNGVYYFHNLSIPDLAKIAGRFYGVEIEMDNNNFAGRSVTGVLHKNKIADFLTDLETTAHVKYHYAGNVLYLQ